MRVVKLADGGDIEAEVRLASEMLCLEHAARAYGPSLEELDRPHEPWPLVRLPPLTSDGEEVRIHYKPVVGYVYLACEDRFDVSAFADRIGVLLHAKGAAHLREHKAVGAAGAMVARAHGRIYGGEWAPPPRLSPGPPEEEKPYFVPRAFYRNPGTNTPARCDSWAGFTWYFAKAASGVVWSESEHDASDEARSQRANALVAGVVYDRLDVFRVADGDSVMGPNMAMKAGTPEPDHFEKLRTLVCRVGYTKDAGIFLVGDDGKGGRGRLVVIGDRRAVRKSRATAAWFEGLQAERWPPQDLVDSLPRFPAVGSIVCMRCQILVSGRFAVVRRAVVPARKDLRGGAHLTLKNSEPLLDPEKGFALCRACAQASSECLAGHMKASVTRSEAPWSQAQAFSTSDVYSVLVPLLRAEAWTEPDAAGAVMVGLEGGATIVLAGARLGPKAELTHEFLARRRLPVLDLVYLGVGPSELLEP
jgi:hypothetical protein